MHDYEPIDDLLEDRDPNPPEDETDTTDDWYSDDLRDLRLDR